MPTPPNIQNHADYEASGFGMGASMAMNGTGSNDHKMTPKNKNSTAQGKASTTVSKSVGIGQDCQMTCKNAPLLIGNGA